MTDLISALPSPTQPIRHESVSDGAPDTKALAFNEIWQDRESGPTFGDLLDIINPLQHIPVVSTIYRMVTGDEIGLGARLVGGALFGGPLGFAAAGIVAGLEEASGGTVEQHVASLLGLDDSNATGAAAPAQPQLAAATLQTLPASPAAASSIPTLTMDQAAALIGARTVPAAGGQPSLPAPPALPARPSVASRSFPARPANAVAAPVQGTGKTPDKSANAAPAADAASARIARKIAEAQRAQAGLLIANLQAAGAVPPLSASSDEAGGERGTEAARGEAVPAPMPFSKNPYMLPPNAPSSLVAKTMERALQRYQQGLQRQTAAVPPTLPPPAAPATVPAR